MEDWGRNFEDAFKWKIGNGKEISFWEDNWAGCGVLTSVFPRLFSLSTAKVSKLAEFGGWINSVWVWHLAWRRRLFKWENLQESQLLQVLQGLRFDFEKEDSWVWKDGEFF